MSKRSQKTQNKGSQKKAVMVVKPVEKKNQLPTLLQVLNKELAKGPGAQKYKEALKIVNQLDVEELNKIIDQEVVLQIPKPDKGTSGKRIFLPDNTGLKDFDSFNYIKTPLLKGLVKLNDTINVALTIGNKFTKLKHNVSDSFTNIVVKYCLTKDPLVADNALSIATKIIESRELNIDLSAKVGCNTHEEDLAYQQKMEKLASTGFIAPVDVNSGNRTLLDELGRSTNYDILKTIIKAKYDLSKDYETFSTFFVKKITPLISCILNNNMQAIEILVMDAKVDINHGVVDCFSGRKYTALSFALQNLDIAEYLLDNGGKIPNDFYGGGKSIIDKEFGNEISINQYVTDIISKRKKIKKILDEITSSNYSPNINSLSVSEKEKVNEEVISLPADKLAVDEAPTDVSKKDSEIISSTENYSDSLDVNSSSVSEKEKVNEEVISLPADKLAVDEAPTDVSKKDSEIISSTENYSDSLDVNSSSVSEKEKVNEEVISLPADKLGVDKTPILSLDDLLIEYFRGQNKAVEEQIRELCYKDNEASLQLIQALNSEYFNYQDVEGLVSEVISNPKLLHQYFIKRKVIIENQASKMVADVNERGWVIGGSKVLESDAILVKSKMNSNIYIKISDEYQKICSGGLDNLSLITSNSLGQNGIKLRKDKGLVVLKTDGLGKNRLVAKEIYQNGYSDMLIIFKNIMNHKEIEQYKGGSLNTISVDINIVEDVGGDLLKCNDEQEIKVAGWHEDNNSESH